MHPVYSVAATGSEDATVIIWECDTAATDRVLRGHTGAVNSVRYDSTGQLLGTFAFVHIWLFLLPRTQPLRLLT